MKISTLTSIEIHVVDHCNLKCANCNHFSPIAEPWYISIENFTEQMQLLKQNCPWLTKLQILGGEPCLHPQIEQLCQIARDILPNEVEIIVLTNGTVISKIEKLILIEGIRIAITPYILNDIASVEKIPWADNIFFLSSRPVMSETLVDPINLKNKNINFQHCHWYTIPCLTLKEYRIYLCPFAAHINHYFKAAGLEIKTDNFSTLLDIRHPISYEQLKQVSKQPTEACQYCQQDSAVVPYHKSYQDIIEYTCGSQDLYYLDYPRYENIYNGNIKDIYSFYTNEQFPYDKEYAPKTVHDLMYRFIGKIDIIIPHYNITKSQVDILINNLQSQTIIDDCVIYFINDGYENDYYLTNALKGSSLNYVLLKNIENVGPGAARNKGIEYSYNPYLYFLDSDDGFIKENALEELYNSIKDKKLDMYGYLSWTKDKKSNQQQFIISRAYLNNKHIRYFPLYLYEDALFYWTICLNTDNKKVIINKENIYSQYTKDNPQSLTATCSPTQIEVIFNMFIATLITKLLLLQQDNYNLTYKNIIKQLGHDLQFVYDQNKNTKNQLFVESIASLLLYHFPLDVSLNSAILSPKVSFINIINIINQYSLTEKIKTRQAVKIFNELYNSIEIHKIFDF